VRGLSDLNAAAAKVEETNYNSDAGPDYLNDLQISPLAHGGNPPVGCIAIAASELHVTDELRPAQLHEGCFLLPLSGHIDTV
jgi:hypothetical protein